MGVDGTEQVDHRAEARNWLDAVDREGCAQNYRAAEAFSAIAQVHASLAVAEGQERVAEEIKLLREQVAGWL